jgi:hypothetical protein
MGRPWGRAICVLVALAGCRAPEPVPTELIHVWRTAAPAYRDRHLEVRKDLLVFGTSSYQSELYLIEGFDREPADAGSTRYTIHYRAQDGGLLQLKVLLIPGNPASLRIDHIDDDWHADTDSADPEKGA